MKGININCSKQDFIAEILSGKKKVETRNKPTLTCLVGEDVGLIQTGKGKATLVGVCTIGFPIIYHNAEEFDADYERHRVGPDSDYHINKTENNIKYGYPLLYVKSVPPKEVNSRGIVFRDLADIDLTDVYH